MHARNTAFWWTMILMASLAAVASKAFAGPPPDVVPVGAAKIDVTPDFPVRLVGYASRTEESEGVAGRLWARALAIGGDSGDGPAILLSVENCGVPAVVTEEVAKRLGEKAGIRRERLIVCSTHSHTAPWLRGFVPWHYSKELPAEHQEHIDRYTNQLAESIERVALEALKSRKPGRLARAEGRLGFAANRRVLKEGRWAGFGVNTDGPVDHSMPLLRVTDTDGNLVAVVINYACHCTTLTGRHNRIHGDWAGCAQQVVESEHPGALGMVTIGCGADANPEPRGELELTERHGRAVADEVNRLLAGPLKPLAPKLTARRRSVPLPFDALPTREELQKRAEGSGRHADHARSLLNQLDRGGLPEHLEYHVTTWTFGGDLAMVFLPGEVVVDYVLRLKRELDGSRLWVTAYANAMPCYIASKRLLREGGYEVDSSMVSYGQPTRLAPGAEDRIIAAVRSLVPDDFIVRSP